MLKGSFTCAGGASVLVVAVVCALAFSARTIGAFSITAAPVRRSAFGRPYVRSSYSRNGRTVLFMAQGGKKKRRRRRKDASVAESFSDLDDAKGLDEEAKEELFSHFKNDLTRYAHTLSGDATGSGGVTRTLCK